MDIHYDVGFENFNFFLGFSPTHCLCIGEIDVYPLILLERILVKVIPYKQHYGYHYSWYISILPLDRYQNNLWCYTLDKVYPSICSLWTDDQFHCMSNIYIQVYFGWYNLLWFFLLLIDISPFNNSYLSELLTKLKVIKVMADPSAFVHLFQFLIGITIKWTPLQCHQVWL